MALKLYASVVKGLKLKVKKFWAIVCTFVEAKAFTNCYYTFHSLLVETMHDIDQDA